MHGALPKTADQKEAFKALIEGLKISPLFDEDNMTEAVGMARHAYAPFEVWRTHPACLAYQDTMTPPRTHPALLLQDAMTEAGAIVRTTTKSSRALCRPRLVPLFATPTESSRALCRPRLVPPCH